MNIFNMAYGHSEHFSIDDDVIRCVRAHSIQVVHRSHIEIFARATGILSSSLFNHRLHQNNCAR